MSFFIHELKFHFMPNVDIIIGMFIVFYRMWFNVCVSIYVRIYLDRHHKLLH